MLRERLKIRNLCLESLKLYRRVEREMPLAPRVDRYARIIEKSTGADAATAKTIIPRIAESLAVRPLENRDRPINLRDIVRYLAVTDCLKIDLAIATVRERCTGFVFDIVAEVIPANL